MCPVGFSMTETAVGIRCTGKGPGSGRGAGGNHALPSPARMVSREMPAQGWAGARQGESSKEDGARGVGPSCSSADMYRGLSWARRERGQ